jgi:hypothetical protein
MKYLFSILLFCLYFLIQSATAQQIHIPEYENQADLSVFVVDYKSEADLLVYKVKYDHQAKGNTGKWFFVKHESSADKTVWFADYKSNADLKIFFVEYKSEAGWKNEQKKYLLY